MYYRSFNLVLQSRKLSELNLYPLFDELKGAAMQVN